MTDESRDDTHDLRPTRRQTLGGTAGLIAAALGIDPSTAQEAIDATGGSLMALTEATNVAGDLYVGPDSAKGTVTPETGRVYKAVDTGAEYYADGSSWTKQPVDAPSVQTDEQTIRNDLDIPPISDGWIGDQQIDTTSFDVDIRWVLRNPNSQYDNYAMNLTRYWEPPYNNAQLLPDHGGFGSASTGSGDGFPDGCVFAYVDNDDYIYAILEDPIEVAVDDLATAFSNGAFNWTKVHEGTSGQSGDEGTQSSTLQTGGGRWHAAAYDPDANVHLIGEEYPSSGSTGSGYEPVIWRSTDGTNWSEATRFVDQEIDEIHSLAPDPFVDKQWVAALGDNGPQRYVLSTDGGQSWTRKDWAYRNHVVDGLGLTLGSDIESNQSVGIGFDADRFYFNEDNSPYLHGPWYVDRETEEKGLVCSVSPYEKFDQYLDNAIDLGLWVDHDRDVIYGHLKDTGDGSDVFWYARHIGDEPHFLKAIDRADTLYASEDWLLSKQHRIPRLDKGGIAL